MGPSTGTNGNDSSSLRPSQHVAGAALLREHRLAVGQIGLVTAAGAERQRDYGGHEGRQRQPGRVPGEAHGAGTLSAGGAGWGNASRRPWAAAITPSATLSQP